MTLEGLRFDERGLLTVVAQDAILGEIRMVAHANAEALQRTLETSEAWFFSRSRGALWKKGESSGHVMRVLEVWADCDGDAVVYLVAPQGPTCHTNAATCFFRRLDAPSSSSQTAAATLGRLDQELEARRQADGGKSYTRTLLDAGIAKINGKILEESNELAVALAGESDERVASEAADVLYHVLVGLLSRGLHAPDALRVLRKRFGVSGLEEKASRGKVG